MLQFRIHILVTILSCWGTAIYGQSTAVRATIEPSSIQIGERAVISVEAVTPKGVNVFFHTFSDTIVQGLEVLRMEKIDTTMTEVVTMRQRYIVTSFDSTLYHIPSIAVYSGSDTLYTNDLGLKVTSPELTEATLEYLLKLAKQETDSIDFEQLGINDIKPIQPQPFSLLDLILDYLLLPFLILMALALIGVIIYFIKRKQKKGYFFTPEIVLPPHTIALNKLNDLKESKMWLKGKEKEFYTKLTDILREYIETRYGISAPEMITEDILTAVRRLSEAQSTTDSLRQILQLADLVKFAKYTPFIDEHDLSMVNAFLFVNQTKLEEIQSEEKAKESGKSDILSPNSTDLDNDRLNIQE